MLTHKSIWEGIDRLAKSSGLSTSGLAKQAGLDPTTFNKSKRTHAGGRERWPSTESIARCLSATGATMSDFLALIDDSRKSTNAVKRYSRSIPLLGLAKAGREGYFDADGIPSAQKWDAVSFPEYDSDDDDEIFALEVDGDSMEPLYRKNDVLVVSPTSSARKGDRVVVKTSDGEIMAKELLRKTSSKIVLKSLNKNHKELTYATSDIDWIARILWVSQ